MRNIGSDDTTSEKETNRIAGASEIGRNEGFIDSIKRIRLGRVGATGASERGRVGVGRDANVRAGAGVRTTAAVRIGGCSRNSRTAGARATNVSAFGVLSGAGDVPHAPNIISSESSKMPTIKL